MAEHDAESTYPYGGVILTLPFSFEEMADDEDEEVEEAEEAGAVVEQGGGS
jgi:hypothetical protein